MGVCDPYIGVCDPYMGVCAPYMGVWAFAPNVAAPWMLEGALHVQGEEEGEEEE